jgi:pyruvate/2-oxoglutarate/acetoin dehydrogenase E1 component
MIELSMADVAGGGIVVGAGLMMTRPIYVIRYQGFNWYNCPMIVNYACKSKEIWKKPCPILVRGIAMEGGIGPVAGSSHHSLYYRMPGVKILSPMTPREYKQTYEYFMNNDDVIYVSEHRGSYDNTKELNDIIYDKSDLVIFAISITRFEALKVQEILKNENINISVINMFWIKPYKITQKYIKTLKNSKFGGLVIDDDYEDGIAKSIANDLSNISGKSIKTLGLKNKTAGFHPNVDNLPPNADQIYKLIKKIIKK